MVRSTAIFIMASAWGVLLQQIARIAVAKRTDARHALVSFGKATALWALADGAAQLSLYLAYGASLRMMELALVLSACLILSAVDWCTRRIPNWIVLFLLAGAFLSIGIRRDWASIGVHLLGAVLGTSVFLVPRLLGMQAGMGDIKLAATIGLYLGAIQTICALLIMSVLVLLYTVFLVATKRGSMKSAIAYGPYMTAGFFVTLTLLR